jgi:hypothetical protein
MGKDLKSAVFVCYEDIIPTGITEGFNPVVYNPILKKEEKRKMLARSVQEMFNVILADDELDSLCKYDKYHLEEFVEEIRKCIY